MAQAKNDKDLRERERQSDKTIYIMRNLILQCIK